MIEKVLGKITHARFGYGGYQAAQVGASFSLSFGGSCTNDFFGFWGMEPSEHSKWDSADQRNALGDAVLRLRDILNAAGVMSVHELVGKPVEVTVDGNKMLSWRILKEVL